MTRPDDTSPASAGTLSPYEGEYVYAELVDDEDPADDTDDRSARDERIRAAAGWTAHCAATAVRAVAGHTGPGLRHAAAIVRHWMGVAYMSDEEIRRRLIKRHLDEHQAARMTAQGDVDRLRRQVTKLAEEAARYGLTNEAARRLRHLNGRLALRAKGLASLEQLPFAPLEPTLEQIRRARSMRALGHFAAVLPAAGVLGALASTAPLAAGAVLLPLAGLGGLWFGRHPIELTERALPPGLLLPELDRPAAAAPDGGTDAHAEEDEEDLTPFPIADATSPAEAEEALFRAIRHEGRDVAEVTHAVREPWGWTARARFRTGSPDDLNKEDTYKRLITLLRLRRNGLLIEADPDAGDSCVLRVLERSPFTAELVGPVPYRAPLSALITAMFDFGVVIDASSASRA